MLMLNATGIPFSGRKPRDAGIIFGRSDVVIRLPLPADMVPGQIKVLATRDTLGEDHVGYSHSGCLTCKNFDDVSGLSFKCAFATRLVDTEAVLAAARHEH